MRRIYLFLITFIMIMLNGVAIANGKDDNYSSSNNQLTQCTANKVTQSNGNITQTICMFDAQNLIRLDSVTMNETETVFSLTYKGSDSNGFCLWPEGHKYSLVLIDIDTQKKYRLLSKESNVATCDLEQSSLTYEATDENRAIKLLYNSLPKTAINLMLIEEDITLPTYNGTSIGPFKLQRKKKF